jgi:hypothetical protein
MYNLQSSLEASFTCPESCCILDNGQRSTYHASYNAGLVECSGVMGPGSFDYQQCFGRFDRRAEAAEALFYILTKTRYMLLIRHESVSTDDVLQIPSSIIPQLLVHHLLTLRIRGTWL